MRAGISSENSSRSSSGIDRLHVRQASATGGLEPCLTTAFGKLAHLEDIGLAFGHRDHAPGIEHVEGMRGFEDLVIGRKSKLMTAVILAALQESTAFLLGV